MPSNPVRSTPAAHQDPGVQPERTLLSWTRTALLLVVVGGFMLRWTPYYGAVALTLFVAAVVAAGGVTLTQRRRLAHLTWGIAQERYPPAVGTIAGLALTVMVLGVAAMVLLLVS